MLMGVDVVAAPKMELANGVLVAVRAVPPNRPNCWQMTVASVASK